MQRRSAAMYSIFFLLIAVGAYAMIGVAQEPVISLESPTHSVSPGQQITVDGRTYTAASISDGRAELTWINESTKVTESWDANSIVTVDDTDFSVEISGGESPTQITLRESHELGENVTTVETGGDTFVVINRGTDRVLVPRDEYLQDQYGAPEVREFTVGDQFTYQNTTVEVASVTPEATVIAWTEPQENTVSMGEGDVVTLNDNEFIAHFPSSTTLELTSNVEEYNQQLAVIDKYHERINGLWGVSILSSLAAILILGLAYLPSRY